MEILYDHVVTEICGEDMVEKLRIKNVKTEAEKIWRQQASLSL